MQDILIREANRGDAKDIAEIEKACFPKPWSQTVIERDMNENGKARYYIALVDGKAAGYMSVWAMDYEGYINNIAVLPGFRRRKIASMMLDMMLYATEAEGIVSHTLEVRESNTAARNLYEKFSFHETGRREGFYSDNGEDAIIMWRIGADDQDKPKDELDGLQDEFIDDDLLDLK